MNLLARRTTLVSVALKHMLIIKLDVMGPCVGNLTFKISVGSILTHLMGTVFRFSGFKYPWTTIGAQVQLISGPNLARRHALIFAR